MSEYIQSIVITATVETNKQTLRFRGKSLRALKRWLRENEIVTDEDTSE